MWRGLHKTTKKVIEWETWDWLGRCNKDRFKAKGDNVAERKKTEIRKEELKGTLQKHDIAGSPQNCKISTPKPGGSVSDKSFDHQVSPESKSHKVTELFRGNDEEKYQAEASKCNWLSKWSKKSRYKKGNAAGHQRGIVDEQESGYCGNLCSEQQLKEFQDNTITTMKRVWNYRHKILKHAE
jgi:hypothetical protein